MDVGVNYLAVLGATVAAFVVGWAWYSPLLFVKPWMRARGMDPEAAMAGGMQMSVGNMVTEFVSNLVIAYVLAHFVALLGVVDWMGALELAVWVWVGFYATLLLGMVLWDEMSWQHYAISAGRWLVTLAVMAVILGVWH